MRYLGIDYGTKRIGVAVSDELGSIAFPYAVIENDSNALKRIGEIVNETNTETIVVGEPVAPEGEENAVMGKIRLFAEHAHKEFSVPVKFVSEQFTSVEASRFAPGGAKNDASAAALILQRFLDMNAGGK